MCVRTSRFAAASLPVTSPISFGKRGSGRLRLGGEEPFGSELLLQALERREVRTDAEAFDRQHLQPQLAALLVELRPPEDVHPLAVAEAELQGVEPPARHLRRETGAVLRILEREEHRRPAVLAAKLCHLTLDPERRQPPEPDRDAFVERRDRVDLPPLDLCRFDLHQVDARGLEQDLGGRLERAAAARDQLDRAVQVGLGMRELLGERQGIPGLDQDVEAPGFDLLALRLGLFDRLGHGGSLFALS